jgi:hypothetical protein
MFNSTKKTFWDGVTILRRNRMLLSHFERNRDAIPPHLKPCLPANQTTLPRWMCWRCKLLKFLCVDLKPAGKPYNYLSSEREWH